MADPLRYTDMGFPHPRDAEPGDFTPYGTFMVAARDYIDAPDDERADPEFTSVADPTDPEQLRGIIGSFRQIGFEYGGGGNRGAAEFISLAQEKLGERFEEGEERLAFQNALQQAYTQGQTEKMRMLRSGMDLDRPPGMDRPATPTPTETPPPTPTPITPVLGPDAGTTGGAHMNEMDAAMERQKQQILTLEVEQGMPVEEAIERGWIPPTPTPTF
jgi:hypothetical protein